MAFALLPFAAAAAAVTVRTPTGEYAGQHDPALSVDAFLGIRYAEAPEGARRFLPPVPVAAHGGVYNATQYGSQCWQPGARAAITSEDCLYLNVWRPAGAAAAAPLAVMFFIHGGGFSSGSGGTSDFRPYDGTKYARKEGVVVVTINYRLGPLGFFASRELQKDSDGATGGANGLRDQMCALGWVRDNIASFGGDPGRVFAFGESAGSHSVSGLVTSPKARGLFRRAGMESAAGIARVWKYGSVADGLATGAQLMSSLRVTSVDALRRVAPSTLISAFSTCCPGRLYGAWHDGYILPDGIVAANWASGAINVDEVLMGGNSKDGTTPWYPDSVLPVTSNSSAEYAAKMDAHWADIAGPGTFDNATLRTIREDRYPLAAFGGNAISAFVQADGDFCSVCPHRRIATQASAAGRKVYLYMYEHLWMGDKVVGKGWRVPPGWATHASELAFVFGNPGSVGFNTEEEELSRTMMSYWGSFARDGVPSAQGAPVWPAFDGRAGTGALSLAAPITARADFRSELCDFWDAYF